MLVEKEWIAFGHRFTERCGHAKVCGSPDPRARTLKLYRWSDAYLSVAVLTNDLIKETGINFLSFAHLHTPGGSCGLGQEAVASVPGLLDLRPRALDPLQRRVRVLARLPGIAPAICICRGLWCVVLIPCPAYERPRVLRGALTSRQCCLFGCGRNTSHCCAPQATFFATAKWSAKS